MVIVNVAALVVLVVLMSVAAIAQSFSSGSTGASGFVTVLLISVAPIVSAQSQKPLTNEDVVKIVAAGLSESTIVIWKWVVPELSRKPALDSGNATFTMSKSNGEYIMVLVV